MERLVIYAFITILIEIIVAQGKNTNSLKWSQLKRFFVDDDFLFDDMKLNAKQLQAMNTMQGQLGSAILGPNFKWDGSVMPFKICKETISDPELRRIIEDSVISFNKRNCGCFYIRWVEFLNSELS